MEAQQDRTLINQRKSMFQGDMMDHDSGTRMGAAMCQETWWVKGTVWVWVAQWMEV